MGCPNLLISVTIIASLIVLCSPSMASSSSIYDVLSSHGLPPGLLPKGIANFTIDPITGRFEAQLNDSCNAKLETDFHYESNVSGTLGFGQIGQISGVSAQDLFLWLPVDGIRVDVPSSGLIYFDVGGVRKQFSLSSFETPQDCTASQNPNDLILFNRDAQIVQPQNQFGKLENVLDQGSVLKAAS